MSNLFHQLFTAAHNDRPFLIEGDREFTYARYEDHARKLGAAVLGRGLQPGDRLVAQMDKSADGFALWLGCLAAGVVYVPVSYTHLTLPTTPYV